MSISAWLDCLVCLSVQRQFPGFEIVPGDVRGAPTDLVGIVGFRDLRGIGALGVAASRLSLQRLSPDIGDGVLDHADWIAEIANRALGGLKLQLGAQASSWVSSTPVVLRDMSLRISRTAQTRTYVVRDGEHILSVWLEVGAFPLDCQPQPAVASVAAKPMWPGESLIF